MAPTRQKPKPKEVQPLSTSAPVPSKRPTGIETLERESLIKKALEDVRCGRMSASQACKQHGLATSTLHSRLHGAKARHVVHDQNQKLTPLEEQALAEYCRQKGWRGEPLKLEEIRKLASEISGTHVGLNWAYKFKTRNPSIASRTTQKAESKHSQALNPEAVKSFYDELERVIKDYDIHPSDIWNADEKGVFLGGGDVKFRTLVAAEMHQAFSTGDENRKMVTILECIRSNGESIPPLLIHEGAAPDGEWIRDNPDGVHLACSPTGWTSNEIAVSWENKIFEPLTRKVKQGRYRLLILDGHVSHCSLEFILTALKHDIIILCLPPHTTHKLQPCDVGVFSHLSREWKIQAQTAFTEGLGITKKEFSSWYAKARRRAITEKNLKRAFEMCGIWPVNRNAIKETDLALSLSTTIQASQPLPATLAAILEPVPNPSPPCSPLPAPPAPNPAGILASYGRFQIKNRPQPPGPNVRRESLHESIAELHGILDECLVQMSWDHAQKVIMERENGEICLKWKGKKGDRSKVTCLVTNARVLTSEECVNALYESDRKKGIGEALKEAGPILKELQRRLENGEKEWRQEQEALEKSAIKAAEKEHKDQCKQLTTLTKKLESARALRTKADSRRHNGVATQTRARNERVYQETEETIHQLEQEIRAQTVHTKEAETTHQELVKARANRLAAIAEAEKKIEDAVTVAEMAIADANRPMRESQAKRLAYRAAAQKPPRDPRAHWAKLVAERPEIRKEDKENQLDVRVQHLASAPEPSVVTLGQVVRGIVEIDERMTEEDRLRCDPEIRNIDINNLAAL